MTRKPQPMEFSKKLVLNQYMLSLFGVKQFDVLIPEGRRMDDEGVNDEGVSNFLVCVTGSMPRNAELNEDILLEYDRNITAHTQAINLRRQAPIRWKYFQYIALLFAEIYLDHYINDRDNLLAGVQNWLNKFNRRVPAKEHLLGFTEDDLRRIAFWSATGSGKTLIMHMNIRQFQHYLNKAGEQRSINRTLLITPNERLSYQHLQEMHLSGITAALFDKNAHTGLARPEVEIIDINKFADRDGDKQVAVDSFEQNNFILVDEGHRGSSGDKWLKYRRNLAKNGFTIEYSATLGQAVASKKALTHEYAKSIVFDYSYRYFYGDGFGKDHRIFNFPEDEATETREMYLTACMLAFHQQKMLFKHNGAEAQRFNIENPLCVFVGSSVNAVRKVNKKEVSDVLDFLQFLARLTAIDNKAQVIERIDTLKQGNDKLKDKDGKTIFGGMFTHLIDIDAGAIYTDMLRTVFNAETGVGLHLDELKGVDGEIALRLGENKDFGVINVGDATTLCKLCKEHRELIVSERNFTDSLFKKINGEDSTINILIGSKRFSEGWNSWRVSTMGLMNVGTSEGSQIIQLFGRGVRLKGYEDSLKRHTRLDDALGIRENDRLNMLERLNIFGIRANYMDNFKKYLEDEGVGEGTVEEILHTIRSVPNNKLKTITLEGGLNFKKKGGKFDLKYCKNITGIILDREPKMQSIASQGVDTQATQAQSSKPKHLSLTQIAMLDCDALYFDLQRLKKQRGWFNLCISTGVIREILSREGWYDIFIPEEDFKFKNCATIKTWQDIASSLLQKYCDKFYRKRQAEWEAPYRKYTTLKDNDPNIVPLYRIYIDKHHTDLIQQVQALVTQVKNKKKDDREFRQHKAIFSDQHLYNPLMAVARNAEIKVIPAGLNEGERGFVEDLYKCWERKQSAFGDTELYLLRNLSRGKGISFFEENKFYPDFILWLIEDEKQKIAFIDPKGLHHMREGHRKIQFHQEIKKIEGEMNDPNVELNSFIISATSRSDVEKAPGFGGWQAADFAEKNIFFQSDFGYIDAMLKRLRVARS